MATMIEFIQALRRRIDSDGCLELDREQTLRTMFVLYELHEKWLDIQDKSGIRFAIEDALGVMPVEQEEQPA